MKIVTISLFIMIISIPTHAESTRFVQWWGEYMPKHGQVLPGGYRNKRSLQYQDVNGDGVYNDALIWYEFDYNKPFSPPSQLDTGKERHRYRTDYPSAIFYGGIVVRLSNVSNVTIKNRDGDRYNPFTKLPQATVQPGEGSRPCSYMADYPNNSYYGKGDEKQRADMTLFIIEPEKWKQPISTAFHKTKNAEVNFAAFYLWRKDGFINGGARTDNITFDETSKISVNFTRTRKNIRESRFIVQDGDQFWISDAVIVPNKKEKLAIVKNGMEIDMLRFGAVMQLNPLNSKWAKYNPHQDVEKVEGLVATLEGMEYKPRKATDEEKQLYQTNSDELLAEVNKMQFNSQTADFIEHEFEDIQAFGVYFATDEFSHKATSLVFDNFQAFAVGKVPAGKAMQLSQAKTETTITGGVSVNCGPYEEIVTQCIPDNIKMKGTITVDSADIGKQADIVAIGIHKEYQEHKKEKFYMALDNGKVIEEWDGNLTTLGAFQSDITLQKEHEFVVFQGKINQPGFVQIIFGYRLQDGSIIYNSDAIDMFIYTASLSPKNDLPYAESIEGLCP